MYKLIVILSVFFLIGFTQDDYKAKRKEMVETQLIKRGLSDQATLEAMGKVPRHKFVPKKAESYAYDDNPLQIGYGQTISQPFIVAYMTELLQLNKKSKVLEIGTGSGYQAAILAEIVDSVYTIEIIKELGIAAVKRLKNLGYKNITVKVADGYYGWEEQKPFDAIIVTAAAEYIPPPLIKQLKEGGKMIIPVGNPFKTQQLILLEKKDGKIRAANVLLVRFVPFTRKDGN
jgi:protein-L-isoaspartate(D-aspartate) O-methyltransferase